MSRRTRYWLFVVAVGLVAALVTLVVICAPRTVPLEQCSELYRRYYDTPGIHASFIKNKRINDTIAVDMTLLKAEDSASYINLLRTLGNREEFISDMAKISDMLKGQNDAINPSFTGICLRGCPAVIGSDDQSKNEVISYLPVGMCVAVFHTHTESELYVVLHKGYFSSIDI